MSNEQWLVYIYGLYPDVGVTGVATSIFLLIGSVWLFYYIGFRNGDNHKDYLYVLKYSKRLSVGLLIILLLSYLIPSKNTFLLLLATPSIVNSVKDSNGKLNKINKLIDSSLDKALENLKEKL